jgi:hypothetical protein
VRRALVLLALTLGAVTPLAAQQPPPRPDTTTLTPQQRALLRLRALGPVAAPDTVTETPDTARDRPQTVEISGRGAPRDPDAAGGRELSAIPRDSIVAALLSLRDYIATEYRGDTAHYRADSARLELRGNPQVSREGNQLAAKELIVYDQQRAFACGYGEPVLSAPQMTNPVQSDTVCYYVDRQLAIARGAQTTVQEGANWHMLLDNAYFDNRSENVYSYGGKFTDCDLPWDHKHYYVGAKQIKVVRHNVMVAKNVTWYFADVPVFWLPFMVQSLSRGRRSGLLMPRFGVNDIARQSARYNRRIEDIGFYVAINDYMGAEVALDWFSNNWTSLRGSLDYRFNRQFLSGGLTYRNYWKEEGGRTFTLATNNSWQPDERTQLSFTANYGETRFVQQRSFDPHELNRTIDSYASVRRRFDWASASLGASRKQSLNDGTTNWDLPSFSLNFSPVTLFGALPGEERWFSNASWNGGVTLGIQRTDVGSESRSLVAQSRRDLSSNVNSGLTVGRVSWSQSLSFQERTREQRDLGDTIPALPGFSEQSGGWSMGFNYQQPLIGTSTLTPGLSLSGQFIRNDSSGQRLVMAPTRLDFSASVQTDLYGFWPGIGPFAAIRHRLSPGFRYNYAPRVTADSVQRRAFSGLAGASDERNTLSISLSQTFEAKYRGDAVDTTSTVQDTTGGPRRRQQARAISLLSISTDALIYDFVRARDGEGITNTQIGNSIQSDLLRGLQLSFAHDLFRRDSTDIPGETRRAFAPHLSTVNASFSLSGNSWLFRVLGLGRRDSIPAARGGTPLQGDEPFQAGPAIDRTQSDFGMIGTSRRDAIGSPRGAVGTWTSSFNYTLFRPRNADAGQTNQMMTGNFSFQPTENWTVRWSTGYSFTTSEFTDHVLTLTRTLHDWDANFDFLKAQNGNFSFQFRVHLRANPDVKLDYSQHDVQTRRQF